MTSACSFLDFGKISDLGVGGCHEALGGKAELPYQSGGGSQQRWQGYSAGLGGDGKTFSLILFIRHLLHEGERCQQVI